VLCKRAFRPHRLGSTPSPRFCRAIRFLSSAFRQEQSDPCPHRSSYRSLDASEHAEEEVEQDLGVGVERLVAEDPLYEKSVTSLECGEVLRGRKASKNTPR
jgi:hypothetical protein